jgi:hypothetical protein
MSILLLNGAPPKYAYAKTLNTFSKRHHRETLVSQSDFWSKSRNDILTNIDAPDYTLQEVGPDFDGAMRQQHVTAGVSFTF